MTNPRKTAFILTAALVAVVVSLAGAEPSVIYIIADDLGYGDLSVYGQTNFSTPNIDRLAKKGMLFKQHYSSAPVCAPFRRSQSHRNANQTDLSHNKSDAVTVGELGQRMVGW
jgi:hypothetical protein